MPTAAALVALGSLIFLAGRLNFIFNLYYTLKDFLVA